MISIGIKYDGFVAKECHNFAALGRRGVGASWRSNNWDFIKRMMTVQIIGTLLKG